MNLYTALESHASLLTLLYWCLWNDVFIYFFTIINIFADSWVQMSTQYHNKENINEFLILMLTSMILSPTPSCFVWWGEKHCSYCLGSPQTTEGREEAVDGPEGSAENRAGSAVRLNSCTDPCPINCTCTSSKLQ